MYNIIVGLEKEKTDIYLKNKECLILRYQLDKLDLILFSDYVNK